MAPLADRAASRGGAPMEDEPLPALPFTVVPSSLEVSSSNQGCETSSGGGNSRPSLAPHGSNGTSDQPEARPSNSIAIELHHYLQQNNLTVNCDPSVIEGYIRFREQAARTAAQAMIQASTAQAATVASASGQVAEARAHTAEAIAGASIAATESAAASRVQVIEAQATALVQGAQAEAERIGTAAAARIREIESGAYQRVGQAETVAQEAQPQAAHVSA